MTQAGIDGRAPAAAPPVRQPTRLNIGWIMPPFVRELPVDAPDAGTAAQALHRLTTELMPEHSTDERFRFALLLGAQLESMVEADVVYAGLCFLEVDERPTASTILVSQVEHDAEDDEHLLVTVRELLERKHPGDDYRRVELPCGPALTRVGASGFVLAAESSPTGRDEPVEQFLVQVFVPLPGTGEMLVFELASPSPEGWDLHCELFAEVLKTVDWGTDQEIADYAAVRQAPPEHPAPSEALRRDLFWHSSRLLDALAVHGPMEGGRQVTSLTCPDCWAKGLRSACSAQHAWSVERVRAADLTEALGRAVAAFSGRGWVTESAGTDATVRLRAGDTVPERSIGYSFLLTADHGAGVLRVEVSSLCTRGSTDAKSVFG
ncbi:hypothetical protein [Streptomyces sp. NPDC003077]|uniref:hypothetical protein n=1 Tax=Streptomyces sp. NPDC003077 TaxID=3154443 RepID=UPI0033BC5F26